MFGTINAVVIAGRIPRSALKLRKKPLLINFKVVKDIKDRCKRQWKGWLKNDNARSAQGFSRQAPFF